MVEIFPEFPLIVAHLFFYWLLISILYLCLRKIYIKICLGTNFSSAFNLAMHISEPVENFLTERHTEAKFEHRLGHKISRLKSAYSLFKIPLSLSAFLTDWKKQNDSFKAWNYYFPAFIQKFLKMFKMKPFYWFLKHCAGEIFLYLLCFVAFLVWNVIFKKKNLTSYPWCAAIGCDRLESRHTSERHVLIH